MRARATAYQKESRPWAGAAQYSGHFAETNHSTPRWDRWDRVTSRNPCTICGKDGWCLRSPDGAIAGCMRIERGSFKTVRTAAGDMYLHRLREDSPASSWRPASPSRRAASTQRAAASIDHRHAAYTAFLERLTLSPEHAAHLIEERKLSHETIARNLYATLPGAETVSALCTELAFELDLAGVPGFYRVGNGWRFDAREGKLLMPCRDHRGRIQAIQWRTDGMEGMPKYLWATSMKFGGPSSGAPAHHALPYLSELQGSVVITEGFFKAETIAERLHVAVIGLAGASSFRDDFGQTIRRNLPAVRKVRIAFDADERRKPHVHVALIRLIHALDAARLPSTVMQWEESAGKGLDDVLVGGGE